MGQLPQDVKATSISTSGNQIFATKSIYSQYDEVEDEKSIEIFDYSSLQATSISIEGYPVHVFGTDDNRIFALSKGYISGNTNLFIEQIQP